MPFMEKIRGCRSLSIVGLEKNTGKTVSLNYVLGRLAEMGVSTAVTSIGVDGEQTDSVYATVQDLQNFITKTNAEIDEVSAIRSEARNKQRKLRGLCAKFGHLPLHEIVLQEADVVITANAFESYTEEVVIGL